MIKIKSDNATIEKNVRFMEQTIIDHGGWVDPDLYIECENGELSVYKEGFVNPGKPLIALPHELLLPAPEMNMGVKNQEMFIKPEKGALTDIQHKLADSIIELYNLTDKIKNHEKTCCWFFYKDAPEALAALMEARAMNTNQNKFMAFTRGESDVDEDQFRCDTYVKTRTIGHKKAEDEGDKPVSTKIMPIVDFINHDVQGAHFNFTKGFDKVKENREFLLVNDSRPMPDSNECYAYYNQMDTMDAFINYGFPDSRVPFVRSIPVEFEIDGIGKIAAKGMIGAGRKNKLHKSLGGLRPFIPPTVTNQENLLEVSYFLIPCEAQTQHALRRVLRLFISNRAARILGPKEIWLEVLKAEEKIIHENVAFYKNLIMTCEKNEKGQGGHCWAMTKQIAQLQLGKLYKYRFEESHFSQEAGEDAPEKIAASK